MSRYLRPDTDGILVDVHHKWTPRDWRSLFEATSLAFPGERVDLNPARHRGGKVWYHLPPSWRGREAEASRRISMVHHLHTLADVKGYVLKIR